MNPAVNENPELLPELAKILIVVGKKTGLDIRYNYSLRVLGPVSVPGFLMWIHGNTNHVWIEESVMNQTNPDEIQISVNWFRDCLRRISNPIKVSINHPNNKVFFS